MSEAELRRRLLTLERRLADVAAEAEADTEYWELVATGQDTEEAEASGALAGYRDGLEYAVKFLKGEISEDAAALFETESRERLAEEKRLRMEEEQARLNAERAGRQLTDTEALDELNLMLSAREWPGASGMEDVCVVVRRTGRTEVPDAPDWEGH